MKTCNYCHLEKDKSEFYKNKNTKDGLSNVCKLCAKYISKKWKENHKYDGRIIDVKRCSTCKNIKISDCFYKDKSTQDGLSNKCKECVKKYIKDNRKIILEKQKNRNKKIYDSKKVIPEGKICSQCKKYKTIDFFWKSNYAKNGLYSCCIECKKKLESTNHRKEMRKKNAKEWVSNNLEYSRKYNSEYDKLKRKTNIAYKLRRNVMHSIISIIRNKKFDIKTKNLKKAIFDHLPYTENELKQHIESLWEPWMNWDNYGTYNKDKQTWQIDHIMPQSKLPFTSFEDENFRKCWALENLQPLETIANIKKGNHI